MQRVIAKFRTFREAEAATRDYYRNLSPSERLEILFQLRAMAQKAGMSKYDFSLIVSNRVELTESLADALYAVGCDDATSGTCEGVLTVDFHREAVSLEEAIRSAVANLRSAGLEVARVEIDAAAVGPAA